MFPCIEGRVGQVTTLMLNYIKRKIFQKNYIWWAFLAIIWGVDWKGQRGSEKKLSRVKSDIKKIKKSICRPFSKHCLFCLRIFWLQAFLPQAYLPAAFLLAGLFVALAFRHTGAFLTLLYYITPLRKIWEEWKMKEWMNEWHTLGLFNIR